MKPTSKIALAFLSAAPLMALAQPQPGRKIVSATPGAGEVTIRNAPDGISTYEEARGLAHITKNVVVTQTGENVVIYAQDMTYNRIRNAANASGQLSIETRESTVRGKQLFADFNARLATITGSVVITSHGKNDGVAPGNRGDLQKKPIKITSDRVDWNYNTRQATVTGHVKITQGPNSGTCDSITYDERDNRVRLNGRAFFGDNENRTFLGSDLLIYLDENRVFSNKPVTIRFKEKDGMNGVAAPPAPKRRVPFPVAPSLPKGVLNDVVAPPPVILPKTTATEEPLPTPRPDEPDVADAPATLPATPTPIAAPTPDIAPTVPPTTTK